MQPVTIREISNFRYHGKNEIIINDVDAGREIKLPKSQVRIEHRRAFIPIWLARKIYNGKHHEA